MIEVSIERKLNTKQVSSLLGFLFALSDEIGFSTSHNYHIDEDESVELLNEYKIRCKERHHFLSVLYNNKDPYLLKSLKELDVDSDEKFEEYKMDVYQFEMSICKQMEKELQKLVEDNSIIDYKEVFPIIKDNYVEKETHMFDSFSTSTSPIDIIVYKSDKVLLKELLKIDSLFKPFFANEEKNIYLTNPVFFNGKTGFAAIYSKIGLVSLTISEEIYKAFKKLKIKHRKEVIVNESEQQQL